MARFFDRLIGLETEYAVRFRPADPSAPRMPRFRIYETVIAALRKRLPTVRARHFKEGVFLANGGAVWFEAERPAAGGGLIEGATPECRTPRQLLAYQRAQDLLLAEAARADQAAGEVRLLKNDRDACDNVYGAQENYEVTVATGIWLWLWRAGLLLLTPLAVATWLGIAACLAATLCFFAVAGGVYLIGRYMVADRRAFAAGLFGADLADGRATCVHAPVWLESTLQIIARVVTGPLAIALDLLLRATVFRRIRRQLTPFLVTRPVIAGAGMIDRQGNFQLSDKGPAINCLLGFGGFWGDRPVYNMGHFFKAIYAQAWFSPREYARLFAARQRLQLGLGDSNMCEVAEYLRVGTTLLVVDVIEAGGLPLIPRMASPIRALHATCRDLDFKQPVAVFHDFPITALQVQRYYYHACCDFVSRSADAPAETRELLDLWREVLDGLERFAARKRVQAQLVGKLDWVTKKYLLDQAAAHSRWEERKKIDLRYHELSADGYFALLQRAGVATAVIDSAELQRALRVPPADSPATARGHYIREFSAGDAPMTASWSCVTLGTGWNTKVIPLRRRDQRAARNRKAPHSSKSGRQR